MSWGTLTYIPYIFKKLIFDFWFKLTGGGLFMLFAFFFNSLYKEALLALLILIIGDFIFGITAAHKTGQEIKSAKVFRSAIKVVVYFCLVSFAFQAEKSFLGFLPLDETVIAFLSLTEFVSIMENMANMGYMIPKKLLQRLKEYRDDK